MIYKCLDCGHIFEEGEEGHYYEDGEFWGAHYSQKISCCPLCKGDYEETVPCEICGSAHLPDELNQGICEECINSFDADINICYEVGANDEQDIKLNGFLATIFEQSAIEEILFEFLKKRQNYEKVDCTEYINQDLYWFLEEVKKNENGKK